MELLALRTGQLLNQSELGRDARLSQPTIHRYVSLLETSHLLERLPAYAPDRTTRLLKSPKVYWTDPGLASFLAGLHDETALKHAREVGAFFEGLVLHHLRVQASLLAPRGRLSFWRPRRGGEVDFVLEHGRRLLAIEVKLSETPRYGDTEDLRAFLDLHPHAAAGVLVHTGREVRRLDDRIVAVPWDLLAE